MSENFLNVDIFFCMLYACATMLNVIAGVYVLFRRGNAFAPDVTPPLRTRRWTAALFFSFALSHVWYLPTYFLPSGDAQTTFYLLGGLFDSLTVVPFSWVLLIAMLQDHRRPTWPAFAVMLPIVIVLVTSVATCSLGLLPYVYAYFMLVCISVLIYMVVQVRRYGRWLCDNYADLEHKEMLQSFILLTCFLVMYGIYIGGLDWTAYEYIVQVCEIIFVFFILWRVETLSDLSSTDAVDELAPEEDEAAAVVDDDTLSALCEKITPLLQHYCVKPRLYLQHDLTLAQLAKAIGTNRLYLSQYFSSQGMNYNAYINDLRINHFIKLYREAVAAQRSFAIKQLAHESGYRSYNTFSDAFKRKTGLPVTAWMKAASERGQS